MFREKLKNDLSGISPDKELISKVTKAMQEEAAKPRQPKHIAFIRFAGMAAAVCMIAVGAVALKGGSGIKTESAAMDSAQADEPAAYIADKSVGVADDFSEAEEIPVTTTETLIYYGEIAAEENIAVPAEGEPLEGSDAAVEEMAPQDEILGKPVVAEETVQEETAAEESEITTLPAEEPKDIAVQTTVAQTTEPAVETVSKALTGGDVLYEGKKYSLSDSEIAELGGVVEKYTVENTHRITDKVLTEDEIAAFEKSGLAVTLHYDDGSAICVYADDENAYICAENTFHLSDNVRSQIITYAEAVRLKKLFGF